MLLVVLYRAPSANAETTINLFDFFRDLALREKSGILVSGDFNIDTASGISNAHVVRMEDQIRCCELRSLVEGYTRETATTSTKIDHLLRRPGII